MAQIPNLVPATSVTDVDLLVTRQDGVDKNFSLLVMKNYLGVPAEGITPYMGTVLDDANAPSARATLGVTRATSPEAIDGTSSTETMAPSTTKEAIFTHAVPAGSPVPWPTDTAPSGWAECDGGSFSVSTYPNLALAYPSGVLPDLRGEFIRGWDHSKGVDVGRTVYSPQNDLIKNHGHEVRYDRQAGAISDGNGGLMLNSDNNTTTVTPYSGVTSATPAQQIGGNDQSAVETRPRNVSFMYIVRLA